MYTTSDLLRLLAAEGAPYGELASAVTQRFGADADSQAWLGRTLVTLLRDGLLYSDTEKMNAAFLLRFATPDAPGAREALLHLSLPESGEPAAVRGWAASLAGAAGAAGGSAPLQHGVAQAPPLLSMPIQQQLPQQGLQQPAPPAVDPQAHTPGPLIGSPQQQPPPWQGLPLAAAAAATPAALQQLPLNGAAASSLPGSEHSSLTAVPSWLQSMPQLRVPPSPQQLPQPASPNHPQYQPPSPQHFNPPFSPPHPYVQPPSPRHVYQPLSPTRLPQPPSPQFLRQQPRSPQHLYQPASPQHLLQPGSPNHFFYPFSQQQQQEMQQQQQQGSMPQPLPPESPNHKHQQLFGHQPFSQQQQQVWQHQQQDEQQQREQQLSSLLALLQQAVQSPLVPALQQQLSSAFQGPVGPALTASVAQAVSGLGAGGGSSGSSGGLQPEHMRGLTEHNSPVAAELLLALVERHPEAAAVYAAAVAEMPMCTQSVEVLSAVVDRARLPDWVLTTFLSNCMQDTNATQDSGRQSRQVKLLCACVGLVLQRQPAALAESLPELLSFCIQQSRHKQASELYRQLQQAAA